MKKILSNIIFYVTLAICSFLLLSNIIHIIYLNSQETYDFNNQTMITLKDNINLLETNIEAIDNLDTKVYSAEDLTTIKKCFYFKSRKY